MRRTVVTAIAALAAAACQAPDPQVDAAPQPPTAAPAPLLACTPTAAVSLTFDDTFAEQATLVGPLLAARGMRATFFVDSSRLDQPGYMTTAQVVALAQAGNEVGGHTLTHPHLPSLTAAQQMHEVCDDQAALAALLAPYGVTVTSFAYPFGDDGGPGSTTHVVVGTCYPRARDIGGYTNGYGFCGSAPSCSGCPYSETTTPRDRLAIRTVPTSVGLASGAPPGSHCDDTDVLTALGWAWTFGQGVPVANFHHVADSGDTTMRVSVADFTSVLDALKAAGVQTVTLREAYP